MVYELVLVMVKNRRVGACFATRYAEVFTKA